MKPLSSYTCKLTDAQAESLRKALEFRNYKFRTVPYARFAAEKEKTNVVFYESGKLVVQGKGTQEFIEFVLEPEVLQEARLWPAADVGVRVEHQPQEGRARSLTADDEDGPVGGRGHRRTPRGRWTIGAR